MKKTILLLLTSVLCAVFFTGCPGEVKPVTEPEAEYIKVIFDKEKFDEQKKSWEAVCIKNYQYWQSYRTFRGHNINRQIIVKNETVDTENYYWDIIGGSMLAFPIQTIEPENENYLSPDEYEKMSTSKMKSIDDIYYHIEKWYEDAQKKYVGDDGICEYEIEIKYDRNYPVPVELFVIGRDCSGVLKNEENLNLDGWFTGTLGFMVLDE